MGATEIEDEEEEEGSIRPKIKHEAFLYGRDCNKFEINKLILLYYILFFIPHIPSSYGARFSFIFGFIHNRQNSLGE
jgi:hypothetical protein